MTSKTLRICTVFVALALAAGCSKKEGAESAKSGLAWEPVNYAEMSATCKKALACCEEVAKQGGAKTASDYNMQCSGPALWKDEECGVDLKSRVAHFEDKPVPDACK
jgi:hypothetical protein